MLFTPFVILTLFYLLCIFTLNRGLNQLKKGTRQHTPFVSVIVAARDEEKNIAACIEALRKQTYQISNFEIIIINDRSKDRTAKIVQELMPGCPNIKLLNVTKRHEGYAPKKFALTQGIEKALGEILLFTDADCQPLPDWIRTIVTYFEEDVGVVAGFSPLQKPGKKLCFTDKLYALESMSLACVAAGGIGIGRPMTCSGRNFAYRKKVFQEVNGFNEIGHHISGDDDLFLHLVSRKTKWKIRYAADARALVYTAPPANFDAFKNQRTRHASKGKDYKPVFVAGLAAVYLFNLLILAGWIFFPFISLKLTLAALVSFLLKSVSEFIFLMNGSRRFKKTGFLKIFPIAEVLHIPYVVVFGLLGTFKTFQWKGEQFEAQEQREK